MSHFLFSCVEFYTCGISLSDWSALLPLWHKHPVTTRWRGQPGHGKAWLGKGAVKLTDVCGTYEKHESCSKNRMWLMQFFQGVVQCQKTSGRRFGTYKQRTIPSQPSVARVDYSSMDQEDGISLCDTSFSAHKEIHGLETREEHHSYGKHVNME